MRNRATTLHYPASISAIGRTLAVLLIVICIATIAVAAPPATAPAQKVQIVEHSQDDLLIMALWLDRNALTQELDAYIYPKGAKLLVPLYVVCHDVEFAIDINAEEGTATGFIKDEKTRKFRLDIAAKTMTISGKTTTFDPSLIEVHRNDIYVDAKLLGEWFPLTLDIDYNASIIRIIAHEQLPIQARWEREKLHPIDPNHPPRNPNYEKVGNPYRLISGPCIDQTLSFTNQNRKSSFNYSSLITNDLLFMNSSLYLYNNGTQSNESVRFTLSRYDPYAKLLGKMHASELAFGDTYAPIIPLVSTSSPGKGFTVSSYPLDLPSDFGSHTFQGNMPPGWDVQLYRDDLLLYYQPPRDDGRYEFRNVPLLFGMNNFRLVFNGPHGEKNVEEQHFNIGESLFHPHQYFYRLGYSRLDEGGTDLVLQQDYGLRDNLSINGGLSSLKLEDGSYHRYANMGFNGYWRRIFATTGYAQDLTGGWAANIGMQTQVGKMSLMLQTKQLHDFFSEEFQPTAEHYTNRSLARLDGIPVPHLFNLQPMSVELSHDMLDTGINRTSLSHMLSAEVHGLTISHYLNYTDEYSSGNYHNNSAQGTLLLSRYMRNLQLRGQLYYDIIPELRPNTLTAAADFLLPHHYYLSLLADHTLLQSQTDISANLSRSWGAYAYGIQAGYSTNGNFTAGLTISSSAGREPRTGEWRADARPFAGRGIVSACVFVDSNQNGIMDAGEKPVSDVGFFINDRDHEVHTNKKGMALLFGLPTNLPTDISVSTSTLLDPMLTPEKPGVRIVPRPGKPEIVYFPIIVTGEISGTVSIKRNDFTTTAPGIDLELVDKNNKVVRTDRTGFDGYYDMTKVPCGKYTVRISPTQLARMGMTSPVRIVEIPPTGDYIDGVDFLLELTEAQPAPLPSPITTMPGTVVKPITNFTPLPGTIFPLSPNASTPVQLPSKSDLILWPQIQRSKLSKIKRPDHNILPPGTFVPAAIHFAYDQSILIPRSTALLNDVVRLLHIYPKVRVHLVGHTDIRGTREYNIALSERRINAVRTYLVEHGINSTRITSQAAGKDYPVVDGLTPVIHAYNRVVELFYIAPKMLIDVKPGTGTLDLQIEGTIHPQTSGIVKPYRLQPSANKKNTTTPPAKGNKVKTLKGKKPVKQETKHQPKPGSLDFNW